MQERKIKQVLVMRTKFPDGKGGTMSPRKGKLIAQGSHCSMAWLSERIREALACPPRENPPHKAELLDFLYLQSWEVSWIQGNFAKIVLGVDTEAELLEVYHKAEEAGLEVHLITDSGLTEFGGVPTNTGIGIGPDYEDKIDPITGNLKLL